MISIEKFDTIILLLSILGIILGIFTIYSYFKISSDLDPLFSEEEMSFQELDKLHDRVFSSSNMVLVFMSNITNNLSLIIWLALFILVPRRAKQKGKNMIPWGAFSFFLAPIAGLTIVFRLAA